MDWRSVTFDWNQTRAFLVTAEEGSLSAAARALGSTQPTLGRQVAALEDSLGVTLFERVGRALTLTQAGFELLAHVRAMGEAASRVSLAASGQSQTIEGPVAITASQMMSEYYLPPIIKRLRTEAPGIEVEIVVSNEVRDLQRREADIAVRHVRPESPELIAKLVGTSSAHLYATSEYLSQIGRPKKPSDLSRAVFMNYERTDRFMEILNGMGLNLTRDNFKLTCSDSVAAWELVKQGLCIGGAVRQIGDRTPGVEMVLPSLPPFPVPIWLTTHREVHTSRRIRLVYDLLAEELARIEG